MRLARAAFGLALGLALVAAFCAAALVAWATFADRRLPASAARVDVAPGARVAQIVDQMQSARVVSSGGLLSLYLRSKGWTSDIQAAEYDVPAHQTVAQVAAILKAGGHPASVWITVPEGFTAAQIAQRLAASGLAAASDFSDAVHRGSLDLDGSRTRGLEGYLFPDTYLVPRHASASAVAALMTDQFRRELPPQHAALARRLGFTLPQIVTIASMIEREAKVDDERRLIAGVIYNRLRLGMPLEIDATIEYALPQHKTELSLRDLDVNSPYNTYRHTGLPPTPIANPGRKSLLAAFHPAAVDYLYYVYKGHGRHSFSRTLEEQQAAERKFLR